ncbi:MAG: aminopeptidase P N-terminal domain-containing protein [Microcystis sp.]|jgi:Xaa-Pro aminopeptidase|uniref:Xaa-Pro aminopeptidase n=1 Tax=Microcystis flos-aquae Mf_QC_C_20070823_S10D TaxID=2486236 RepID=A0A552KM74_9CHRO|nr:MULTISPECIES: aminopeptidase P N-terminal domain-containing protein [unclassified Microcystis]MCA2818368.1 aminopeptidase P N-terminal domain-containing protein [Microcystis sp. M085S1]MCA2853458.1 aminopeptidase P N-terminal domain-containing protein [Microcystis sp. M065S1]MCZ8057168.1 aminopeptidase P N-terminal domain-containing protein [Microcystis sp. LE19-12.2C]TRU03041.1 MAG: M24 family metallopeptidase [Microcystis flos-aquae Ma_QC_C_20070823_S18D]TRV09077.1 MAG: M24 family metallo
MGIDRREFQQRRQQVMEKIGNGTAIFRSAPMAVMHNDVEYTYRQDSDFFYLTGFNEPDAVAILAPHHPEHQFILFVQPKDPEKETWTGYLHGVEGAKEIFAADEAYSIQELDEKLPQYLEKAERIYYHLGRDKTFNTNVLNHWQKLIATFPRRGTGPTALEDTNFILHPLRLLKTAAELDNIRQATAISAQAHNRAREFTKVGHYEYQIQAEIEHTFRLEGGMGPAYPSIVASGANACILHYINNNRQVQENELLLIDAGCAYNYYNGDITRTFPVNGKFTPEQKIIYEIVLEAQLKAIEVVKTGNPYNLFHDTAVRTIVEGLVDLGLLVGDIDEIIKEEKYKPFYMHRTGHWLGLDVHDAGGYKVNEETWQNLQPGHVLTVEPGIYIAPDIKPAEGQPEVPEKWRGIGIRIEDDVLVTATGNEVLTATVPKKVEDIESE